MKIRFASFDNPSIVVTVRVKHNSNYVPFKGIDDQYGFSYRFRKNGIKYYITYFFGYFHFSGGFDMWDRAEYKLGVPVPGKAAYICEFIIEESDKIPTWCPFCGNSDIEYNPESKSYHCKNKNCDRLFDYEDTLREPLKRQLSAICYDTDENHQLRCDVSLHLDGSETFGMPTPQLPRAINIYRTPSNGTIWLKIGGLVNSDNGYINIDGLSVDDLTRVRDSVLDFSKKKMRRSH